MNKLSKSCLKELPKLDLHCHLDGSLSREFISAQLQKNIAAEDLQITNECQSLREYLMKFSLPISCIQTPEGLRQAGYDYIKNAAKENVIYTEVRFSPLSSVNEQMDVPLILESLLEGLKKGKEDFQIDSNIIVCAMRHHSMEENLRMLKLSREYLGNGVCAADLAGSEADFPMREFLPLFCEAKEMGIPFTIHAGECGSAQNIWDAVEIGARRIGHGIAMHGCEDLKKICFEKRIGIEMCPISNFQTKAIRSLSEYPITEFLKAGLKVTINTDNRTVSNTTLTKEFEFLQEHFAIGEEEIHLMLENAVEVSFADELLKHELLKKLKQKR